MPNKTIVKPQINTVEQVKLPETLTTRLSNNIKLMSLKAGTQQVVRLSLVFHAGTRYQAEPFVASAMLNMLSEGSRNHSSEEISKILDFYGIYYDTNIDRDYAMITVSCLNKFLPQTLDLLEELLLYPTFNKDELEIYSAKRKQNIQIERQRPSFIAREEFAKALFGKEHPYGRSYSERLYDNLTYDQLRAHHEQFYTAKNCFAVASGMVEDKELRKIIKFLEKIPAGTDLLNSRVVPKAESTPEIHIARKDALQSNIRIGKILFPKGDPDYNAMQMVAMILGGYFGSRLVKNLREDKGYTYGIYSAMVTMEHSGYFALATDVSAEHCEDAIRQIKFEIQRLYDELVSDEELEMVRSVIAGELMRLIDGPFGIADITIESEQCSTTNESVNEFLEEIKSMTPERIQAVAKRYLDIETLTVVTVG